ncbi:hypothetical protein [Paracoccus aestuariivivens]|uniref:Uncharacterized protein n=1 Tax=Paracoccus aestuariivivens TaxID=1820333 RepID=A0A6L6JER6_9RHOB|nr:hypothetical protein [Paracoccus aestuariivivens]MTH78421.1 hypothetical protein [Paracoccus aestuariivivens]
MFGILAKGTLKPVPSRCPMAGDMPCRAGATCQRLVCIRAFTAEVTATGPAPDLDRRSGPAR